MKHLRALFVFALALGFAAPVFAETQNVKVSGSIDAYWFYRNNFDLFDGNDAGASPVGSTVTAESHAGSTGHRSEADDYFMTISQIEIAADLTDNVSTVINLINQRDWNANDFVGSGATATTATAASEFDIILDLAYVQMREIFYAPLTLTIGRQDLLFGRGFIIGWNPQDPQGVIQADEFTQVQSFDAIRATLDFNPWTIDFVYAKIDENAHDVEDDRDLYITNVNYKFAEYNAVAEAYYIAEADKATFVSATAGNANNDTHIVGGRVQFDPVSQITLGAELAYQFGDYRGAVTAPERDRSAWAFDIFGTYRWDNAWKPEITIEYVHLSGEDDLSAATSEYNAWNGAFRGPVYGWYHDYKEVYYATSFSGDQAAGQNQQHINIYGSIKPMEDMQLSASYFYFWADEDFHSTPTDPGTAVLDDEIGHEIDTAIIYNYTEDVTFAFYANWFIPGDLYASPTDDTASEYISRVTVTF
jgi:hypothetical protein